MHWGVDPSLHPKYHHQFVFANYHLKIHYPISNERLAWHCKHVHTDLIKHAIEYFAGEKIFLLILNLSNRK